MLTGPIRNQVDQIWNTFWSGGISKKGEDRRIVRIRLTAQGKDALTKLRNTTLPLPQA